MRRELEQVAAWAGDTPVGRGMVLFPEHDEYSISAWRERCAEARDVFVDPRWRRRGVAGAIMLALEDVARSRGWPIGLAVSIDDEAAPARALYASLGYRRARGPYVASSTLEGDDDPFAVSAVLIYLVKDL